MTKIVVASGKGGVGKSMLASSLAILFSRTGKKIVTCDCDVDAPNMGLWLGVTDYDTREKISTSEKAEIDRQKCISCGKCEQICRFSAIDRVDRIYTVNPFLCEGCGACELVCPSGAIKSHEVKNGETRLKHTDFGFPLISGQLYPGEAGSGKIVDILRKKTDGYDHDIVVMDSAAGIGCPVIASIRGTDYALLVTEPTPSGFSDLKRVIEIVRQFNVPYGIVINKWDINSKVSEEIATWAGETLLGKISYDRKVIDSIVNLTPIVNSDSVVSEEIKNIFIGLNEKLVTA